MRSLALVAAIAACKPSTIHVVTIDTHGAQAFAAVDGDVLARSGSGVERITGDGIVRWTSEVDGRWLLADGTREAYVISDPDDHRHQTLTRVDAASGVVTGHASIDQVYDAWYRGGDALYLVSNDEVRAIDPVTGDTSWSTRGAFNRATAEPAADAIWVECGTTWAAQDGSKPREPSGPGRLCGFAAANGASLGQRLAGLRPAVTPDGKWILTMRGHSVAELDSTSAKQAWATELAGNVVDLVASENWVVALVAGPANKSSQIVVLQRKDGKQVWSLTRGGGALGYIAVSRDIVAYFDDADASIHIVRPSDRRSAVIHHFTGKAVVSTDAVGVAPAVPSAAPVIDGSIVLVSDLGTISAYRFMFDR